jgi:hypothetical protein
MFFLIKSLFKLIVIIVVVGLLVGLGYWLLLPEGAALPPFPQLAGYQVVEGETVSDYLAALETSESPEIVTALADLGQIAQCYQAIGGARVQFYRHQTELLKAGAVAMVSQNTVSNPANLINCVSSATNAPANNPQIQTLRVGPCQANYSLPKEEDTIYIVYVGTAPDVCQAFCAQLEGCTAHP